MKKLLSPDSFAQIELTYNSKSFKKNYIKNLKAQQATAHNTVVKVQYCPTNKFKVSLSRSQTLQGVGPHARHWDNMNIAVSK